MGGSRAAGNDVPATAAVSESEIRYPLMLPASRWRRAAKVAGGRLLLALRPAHRRRLIHEGDPMRFSRVDRLMVAGLVGGARTEADRAELSAIQRRFWAGEGGAIFNAAPEVADRFHDWFLAKHRRPLECLEGQLAATGAACPVMCEIGSGNGLALEYLGQRFPAVPRLVGIDINADATRRNAERWREDPRLEFVHADAVEWITAHAGDGWTYFSNAGVLEYLPQDQVERLYRHTAQRGGPSWWMLTEPVYDGYDLATETESRVNGREFSFCHNHPHLLRQAGWEIVEQHETEAAGLRWLSLCARRAHAS